MQRKWFALLILSTCLVVTLSRAQDRQANVKFAQMSEAFIHETLALSPSSASQAGYHKHLDPRTGRTIALDSLLDDVSPAGIAEQRRVYTEWKERFHNDTPVA